MKPRIAVLLVLGILPWAELHAQQTASTTFRVSASVQAACEVTATDLAFGGTMLLRATCTPDSSYNIRLNDGTLPGATVDQRRMVSGAQRSTIWGDTTGTDTVNGVGTGLSQDHTVFGALPAAQVIPPAGGYADTTIVRIYY